MGRNDRYKTGSWVPLDGVYSNEWGAEMVLMAGELFPADIEMGATRWSYVKLPSANEQIRPKQDQYFINEW